MAALNVMPVFTDAALADCGYMPNEAFGAYWRLLMNWWRDGAKPMSERRLRLYAACDDDTLELIKEHLTVTADGWVQKKLFEVYPKQEKRAQAARENGKRGGRPKTHDESEQEPEKKPSGLSDVGAVGKLSMNHEPSSLSKDKQSEARKRATRLSEDFQIPEEWTSYGLDGGLTKAEISLLFEELKTWSLTKKQGTSLDWKRTWQTWCRRHKSWGVKAAVPGIASHETIWPDDPEERERAEALQRRVGKNPFKSYFAKAPPRKNCDGWVVYAMNDFAVSRVEAQYSGALDDIYRRKGWRIEVAP